MLLGNYEAWSTRPCRRQAGDRIAGLRHSHRSGKVEITCTAGPGAATSTLALCERTASTLQLGPQKP